MPSNKHLASIPGPQSDLGVWPQMKGQVPITARCSQRGVSVSAPCDCAGLQTGRGLSTLLRVTVLGSRLAAGYGLSYTGQTVPAIFILEKASQCLL